MTTPPAEPEVLIRREGRAGRITMNRPKALNALTLGMVRAMTPALQAWKDDPDIALVILDGTGDRALCAGGDVRWLYDSRVDGSGDARTFWREEYELDALIHRYPKPYVAIMDGIVMGGGIGISAHAQGGTRIVTERSQLAMPETSIGLVPDVGGTLLLSRAPGAVGSYLGLVGERMHGAGTIYAGFADVFVPSERLPSLKAELCTDATRSVGEIIAAHAEPAPHSRLSDHAAEINRTFDADRVETIVARLEAEGTEWAAATRKALVERSPLALSAALAAIRNARTLPTLEACLAVEYRLCTRLFENGEFIEGVRALIVDKDKSPKWNPPTLAEVSPQLVAGLLAPLPAEEELRLPQPT